MPLTSKDAALFVESGIEQKQVAPNIWISSFVPDDGGTFLKTDSDLLRVNLRRRPLPNTGLSKALAWLRQHEGETVIIAGPDTDIIVEQYREVMPK
jgi:hypothetical protein